jgi:hypothetical protein
MSVACHYWQHSSDLCVGVGWPITAMSATGDRRADIITPIATVSAINNRRSLLVAATAATGQLRSLLLCNPSSDGVIVGGRLFVARVGYSLRLIVVVHVSY